MSFKVSAAEKILLALDQTVIRRRNERHSLLHYCKMNGIEVPLIKGSLADVDADEPIASSIFCFF